MKKTKKQKYSMSEFQRLLCSWTMELASFFEDECDMDQKTALEKAHLNRSLQMYLGDGVVTFYYEKDDGTVRKARGTLEHGISRKFDEYVYVRGRDSYEYEWPREDFTYWDLDKEQFRTFKASRLLKIEAYSAVNVLHEKSLQGRIHNS